jgi:predicted metal-binding transcription factor (methanogenesis marker protein 9)
VLELSNEEIEERRDQLRKMLTEKREKPTKKQELVWKTAVTEEAARKIERIEGKKKRR